MKDRIGLPALAVLALLSLACAGPGLRPQRSLDEALRPYAIAVPDAPPLKVVSESRRQGARTSFHNITAQGPGLRVLIEVISPLSPWRAGEFSRSRKSAIRALYEDPASLYPGERALLGRCPADRRPREVGLSFLGTPQSGLLADAAADYSFGVCAQGQVRNAGLYLAYHDPESSALFQFSVFAPLGPEPREPAQSLKAFLESLTRRPREP